MSDDDEGAFSRTGLRPRERLRVAEQVCKALSASEDVDASQIGVAVDPATGDVTLFGSVPSREQIRLAENCAVSVRGVTVVMNRLRVCNLASD